MYCKMVLAARILTALFSSDSAPLKAAFKSAVLMRFGCLLS